MAHGLDLGCAGTTAGVPRWSGRVRGRAREGMHYRGPFHTPRHYGGWGTRSASEGAEKVRRGRQGARRSRDEEKTENFSVFGIRNRRIAEFQCVQHRLAIQRMSIGDVSGPFGRVRLCMLTFLATFFGAVA